MLFELRTYMIKPGHAPTYLDIFRKSGIHLITRHLPMLGYWMTESGGLNCIQHMWAYKDFEERASKRVAVGADTQWNEGFVIQAFPYVVAQKSQFLSLETGSPLLSNCIDIRNTVHAKQDDETPMFANTWFILSKLKNSAHRNSENQVGTWKVLSGDTPGNQISITICPDSSTLFDIDQDVADHQIMRPLSFSPLR